MIKDIENVKIRKMRKHVKAAAKKMTALVLAAAALAVMPVSGLAVSEVQADEALPNVVRSVYTNEWIPAEQSVLRPIAVMMPTDKVAQPS